MAPVDFVGVVVVVVFSGQPRRSTHKGCTPQGSHKIRIIVVARLQRSGSLRRWYGYGSRTFLISCLPPFVPAPREAGGGNILYGKEEGKIDFGFPDVFRKFIYSDEREMG